MIDSADLDICRLCFASKSTDGSVILNDFQGFESMLQDLAGVQVGQLSLLPGSYDADPIYPLPRSSMTSTCPRRCAPTANFNCRRHSSLRTE